jgi:D-3-phosphoglycerate dehydrogenase / 2-oxoglutarate reductase
MTRIPEKFKGAKVLIGPSSFAEENRAPHERLVEAGFQVVGNPFRRKFTKEETPALLGKDIAGLVAGLETLDREVLTQSGLKVVSRCGAGMANVDLEAARELGIRVYNTPFGPTQAVAEMTVGCLLSLVRQVPQMDRALHGRRWDKRVGRQLKGMTVLLVGLGRIGSAVARLLEPFEVNLVASDPGLEQGAMPYPLVSLDEGLARADVVALHASGQDCLLGRREFGLLRPGAFVLNAARGEVLDEEALREALDSGQVAGAWLDTFGQEPYEGPLAGYEQVILTPHVGSYTAEGRLQMELDAVENLIRAFREASE